MRSTPTRATAWRSRPRRSKATRRCGSRAGGCGPTRPAPVGGAAGWGDALARPGELVADDVANGRVSVEMAAREYGVVLDEDGCLDLSGTERLRARLAGARPELALFDRGELPA